MIWVDYALLGKRIRHERQMLRLTIEQLAELVNKSTNYIGQIERNDGKPSLETVVDIANALGTTVDALLKDSIEIDNDNIMMKELLANFYKLDEPDKQFILDMVNRFIRYQIRNKNLGQLRKQA